MRKCTFVFLVMRELASSVMVIFFQPESFNRGPLMTNDLLMKELCFAVYRAQARALRICQPLS